MRARVVKNKVAPPFRKAELEIMFSQGISKEGSLLDLGVDKGLLKKSGSFYSFGDTRLGQGREAAREFLRRNVEIRDEVEQVIRAALAPAKPEDPPEATKAATEKKAPATKA